jgi:RND family efflux transporter MFP subunit
VVSPINGVVADRMIYPGEMAASGTPLVSIVDVSQVVAHANIPVAEASAIIVGRPARITGPSGDIPGTVNVVSPATSPNSTTVEVWVQTPNPGEKLKPGATVHLAIIAETLRNTIVVPATALLNSDTGAPKVMTIDDKMMAHERMVSLGVRQGDRVQILSGVQEGDKVVVSGGLGLEDKAKVVIDAPKAEDEDEDNADDNKDESADKGAPKDTKGKDTKAKDGKAK